MATAAESFKVSGLSANSAAITIKGGRYLVAAQATFGGGSVAFQGLLPDGTTYATVPDIAGNAATFTTQGWKTIDLCPGQYRFTIATATAVAASASSVPG